MVSASASLPKWARSRPATVDNQSNRLANVGSSSQGTRKPGVWAPWPGATMTSTGPLCRVQGCWLASGVHESRGTRFVGFLQGRREVADAHLLGQQRPEPAPPTLRV